MGKLKGALANVRHEQQQKKVRAGAEKRRNEIELNKKLKKQTHKKLAAKPPFDPKDRILLVGEGDFSFAKSVLENGLCRHVVATAYDSESEVRNKYATTAVENLKVVGAKAEQVVFNVDATNLDSTKLLKNDQFDAIVFNFPHIGNSVKDQARNILQHQKLVVGFFESAKPHLKENGKIVLTLFEGEPYISWGVKSLAKEKGLAVSRSDVLQWESYPGYHHRLTSREGSTAKAQSSRPARIYSFIRKSSA